MIVSSFECSCLPVRREDVWMFEAAGAMDVADAAPGEHRARTMCGDAEAAVPRI
jgi:hypothetical protein